MERRDPAVDHGAVFEARGERLKALPADTGRGQRPTHRWGLGAGSRLSWWSSPSDRCLRSVQRVGSRVDPRIHEEIAETPPGVAIAVGRTSRRLHRPQRGHDESLRPPPVKKILAEYPTITLLW